MKEYCEKVKTKNIQAMWERKEEKYIETKVEKMSKK